MDATCKVQNGIHLLRPVINQCVQETGYISVMPVTVRLNHAVADGYLLANVFRLLEQEIRAFAAKMQE